MDFISVDKNNLKVILSPGDVETVAFTENFDISDNFCDSENSGENFRARSAFRSVLSKARAATGFSAENCKLLVKCFPSLDGGCELFITRLPAFNANFGVGNVGNACEVSTLEKAPRSEKFRKYLFETDSLSNLALACKYLDGGEHAFLSSVYYDDSCGYCLIITLPPKHMAFQKRVFENSDEAFLSELCEFGNFRRLSSDLFLYISEHCRLLAAKDAVKLFSKFTK